jgi:adenylate kinase family enzyme
MPAFLITGNPGSGKTTVALEMTRRGFTALDTDELADWETTNGVPVRQPEHATDEWLRQHRWVWNRTRLEDAIRTRTTAGQPVFPCGIAVNQREMLDCFALVLLLSLDDTTQIDRLDTVSNAHRNEAQRAQIIRGRPVFEQEMKSAGAVVLDGRQPTSRVVDLILHEVRRASSDPR